MSTTTTEATGSVRRRDDARRPLVVMPIGLPGAGKSVVARRLADALGLHVIDRDRIRMALFPRCRFTFAEKRAAFRAVLVALEVNLALGRDCVLDGMTFSRRRERIRVVAIAREYGARVVRLLFDVPPALARARIAADATRGGHEAGDRDPALVDEVWARFERPTPPIPTLDASLSVDALAARALALVCAKSGRPLPPMSG